MFLEYLPDWEWLKVSIAFSSVIAVWGGAAAVGWYWLKKAWKYFRPDKSAWED